MNRTMVKVSATESCLFFRTISRRHKSPQTLCVFRSDLESLLQNRYLLMRDLCSFAAFVPDSQSGTVEITFTWLARSCDDQISGWEERFSLNYNSLMDFVKRSAQPDGPKCWKGLSVQAKRCPKLMFCERKRLHECLSNRTVRRSLVRFLRNASNWHGADRVELYPNSVPYSFTFQEYVGDEPMLSGELILCGQEDMSRAYYSIHI